MKMETCTPKDMGCNKNSTNREVHGNKCQHQKGRKISDKQPTFMPQGTRQKNEAQSYREDENNKYTFIIFLLNSISKETNSG